MMVHACNFWLVSLFAQKTTFAPLKLCSKTLHELISDVDEDRLFEEARGLGDHFIQTGFYELERSHWPYVGPSLNDFMALMNPLQGMDLLQFVHTGTFYRPRHYFKFKKGEELKEFVVLYDRMDDDLVYSTTLSRMAGEQDFIPLNEQVWGMSIRYLVEAGKSHAERLARDEDHFAAKVSRPRQA